MDLFDMLPAEEPGGPPCRCCGMPFDFCDCGDEQPTDAEMDARALGIDRAGVPSWSIASAKVHEAKLRALLGSVTEDRRGELIRLADEAYNAAKAKRGALLHVSEG
jgi:hypothetical protein